MKTKQCAALAIIAVAAGAFLALNPQAQSDANKGQAIQLEGAWVARVPGMPAQWNYVLTPTESSGRRASLYGAFSVRIPGFLYGLPAQYESDDSPTFWGEVMLTGRNEAEGTVIWWGLKNTVPSSTYPFEKQLVVIGVDSFTVSFMASGKTQVTHNMKFYDPSADADGDGLPDPGQDPVFSAAPMISYDTSLTLGSLSFQ
jgi:hypothetical protein